MSQIRNSGLEGVLIVDKPADWSSHDVCQFIKGRFKLKKVGHAGILDRPATGLLVVLLGRYTKLSDRFISEDKAYTGTVRLGSKTRTHDAAGEVTDSAEHSHITEKDVLEKIASFLGEGEQLPPMASSMKLNGVRLYRLAQKGQEVERPMKKINVFEYKVTRFALPDFDFECRVSKGTYVRTLANDIGEKLGCFAHLLCLRRITSGGFHLDDGITIDALKSIEDPLALQPYLKQMSAYFFSPKPKISA